MPNDIASLVRKFGFSNILLCNDSGGRTSWSLSMWDMPQKDTKVGMGSISPKKALRLVWDGKFSIKGINSSHVIRSNFNLVSISTFFYFNFQP